MRPLAIIAVIAILLVPACVMYELNGDSFDVTDRQVLLIVTDSMDGDVSAYEIDSFPADTLVMVHSLPDHEKRLIREGQVISYYVDGTLVSHRVKSIDVENSTVTVAGDRTGVEETVSFDAIEGEVIGTNHVLGVYVAFYKAHYIHLLMFGGIGLCLCAGIIAYGLYQQQAESRRTSMRRGTLMAFGVTAVIGLLLVGSGLAYNASTYVSDNTIEVEYAVLTQTNYNYTTSGDVDCNTMILKVPIAGCTIESDSEGDNTKATITIAGSSLSQGDSMELWVKSSYDKSSASMLLTAGTSGDNHLTVDVNQKGKAGTIKAVDGDYVFDVTVVGMLFHGEQTKVTASKAVYQIEADVEQLCTISGKTYAGTSVGTDTLTADHTISGKTMLVKLHSDASKFKDLSGTDWKYILKVEYTTGNSSTVQYAYFDGSGTGDWSYAANGGLVMEDGKTYDTTLYIAGLEGNGGAYSSQKLFESGDKLIENGAIQFKYDSEWTVNNG